MTEAKWLKATNPQPMLGLIRANDVDPPRLRLFACACLRRVWHLLTDGRSRAAVEAAERDPAAQAYPPAVREAAVAAVPHVPLRSSTQDQPVEWFNRARNEAATAAVDVIHVDSQHGISFGKRWVAATVSDRAARAVECAARSVGSTSRDEVRAERVAQSRLLRDIVFNPFRPPPAVEAAWLERNGGAVPKLARAIRDERAFGRLPLLADALEDAGCLEAELLSHCRSRREHALGCWAVDAILGKQ